MATWFEVQCEKNPSLRILRDHPIAYFCFEFAVSDTLPIYSGGLGVLAGDVLKQANDFGLPIVGVGLYYKKTYFSQVIDESGAQTERYHEIVPQDAMLELMTDSDGKPLTIDIHIEDRTMYLQVWRYLVGDVPLYLLDSDIPQNTPESRDVTQYLYGADATYRLHQEIVLGLGGRRALVALGIEPAIYHMNEGHSALLVVGLIHHYLTDHKMSFADAFARAQRKVVFTNHTLVPAGNDLFSTDMVNRYVRICDEDRCVPVDTIVVKGAVPGQENLFSTTNLALNISSQVNAVSAAHAEHAQTVWPHINFIPITNGVHLPTFMQHEILTDLDEHNGTLSLTNQDLWALHLQAKQTLLAKIRAIQNIDVDPQSLLVTWARRFAAYKQPMVLFSDIERLKRLIQVFNGQLKFLIAGKAHPRDDGGKQIIRDMHVFVSQHGLGEHVIFLPNYSLDLARLLTRGSDVWLNTPMHAQEACGTSGMKAAANGVLAASTPGGWMREIRDGQIGWMLSEQQTAADLYRRLETDILPLYLRRDADGLPHDWITMMRGAVQTVWHEYGANRMLTDYVEKLYAPVLENREHDGHIKESA